MIAVFLVCVGFIFYVYAGYPLLLTLLALGRRRAQARVTVLPSVTLIIAAYNEAAVIEAKLANSFLLVYPADRLQIVVAADGSTDETVRLAQSYTSRGVVVQHTAERRGKTAALNRAAQQATGDILVFSDANNLYRPESLLHLVAPFVDEAVGAVSGAKVITRGDGALGESEGLYWRYESFIKQQETRLGCCTAVAGEILAMRTELFEAMPEEIINDDFHLLMRLLQRGYRVAYAPQARSYERVSPSPGDEITRRTRIVAGRYQALAHTWRQLPWRRPLVVWQLLSHKFFRPLVPLAMIGALVANVAVMWKPTNGKWGRPFTGLLLLQAAFYGLALWGRNREGNGRLFKLLYLPAFLLNSNWAALRGLVQFFTGRQTTRWQRAPRRQLNQSP